MLVRIVLSVVMLCTPSFVLLLVSTPLLFGSCSSLRSKRGGSTANLLFSGYRACLFPRCKRGVLLFARSSIVALVFYTLLRWLSTFLPSVYGFGVVAPVPFSVVRCWDIFLSFRYFLLGFLWRCGFSFCSVRLRLQLRCLRAGLVLFLPRVWRVPVFLRGIMPMVRSSMFCFS